MVLLDSCRALPLRKWSLSGCMIACLVNNFEPQFLAEKGEHFAMMKGHPQRRLLKSMHCL